MARRAKHGVFRPQRALLTSAVVASAALAVTAIGALEVWRLAAARHADQHAHNAARAVAVLDQQATRLDGVLRTANAVYTMTGEVDLAEWRPLLEGLLYADTSGSIVRIGAIGLPDGGLESLALQEPPVLVSKFVQPSAGTVWAVGVDGVLPELVMDELRRSAALGEPLLSGPIDADSYDVDSPVAVLVRPMFLEEEPYLMEVGQAKPTMIGWAFAVLDVDRLLPELALEEGETLCVVDAQTGACLHSDVLEQCTHEDGGRAHVAADRSAMIFGRLWHMRFWTNGHSLAPVDALAVAMIGGGGLALAILLGAINWLFLRTQARASDLAGMTHELGSARDAAQSANRAKSEFLANMSHEIRTPMTAILGYAELLAREELPNEESARCIETVRRNGDHLLTVINDILDISKIEAGRLVIERRVCNPLEIAREAAALVRRRAEAKGLAFSVHADGACPAEIKTDPTRLRQILVNLLSNAVKFTSDGEVRLSMRMATELESRISAIRFACVDSGPGIPEAQLRRLFRPFVQADASMTRRFGGTGLGLAISRSLANALGGDISVDSASGKGSEFRVVIATGEIDEAALLPASEAQAALDAADAANTVSRDDDKPLIDARILLAEDGPDNQRLLRFLLTKAGAAVELVGNGREAIEAVERNGPFDLILLDMQMPEMDGYTAAAALREGGDETPIVALTAHAMTGDRQRCLAAGCDEYLTKPIDRALLISRCADLRRTGRHRSAA